ncbi:MAG: phosphatidate cytidylyltransferase [Clostridiales Family XIII bacterium]|jgi:phosphatidate cytidylyltransferase|nr:phosphatidate cytidylyltransferase [Clostridiales Family XIII bacterium]
MKQRIVSSLIMLPLLAVVFVGGRLLLAACFLIGVAGMREFFRSFERAVALRGKSHGAHPSRVVACAAAVGLYCIDLFAQDRAALLMLWLFLVTALSFLYLFDSEKRRIEDGMATLTGILYICFFSYHVSLVEQLPQHGRMVWLIFLAAFGTDILAFFTGRVFGRHKLCPGISPKKTTEGAVGGFIGSVLFCGAFGYLFLPALLVHCLILGAIGGVVSQLGDLTASVFKRNLGIKDFGDLIPGHGGILDRFDSVLFTAPVIYYYTALVIPMTS